MSLPTPRSVSSGRSPASPTMALTGAARPFEPVARADGLVRGRAVVLEHVERGRAGGREHGARDPRQHASDRGGGVVGQRVERGRGRLRDDQHVPGVNRSRVQERDDVLVFVDATCRRFLAHDAAENAVVIHRD